MEINHNNYCHGIFMKTLVHLIKDMIDTYKRMDISPMLQALKKFGSNVWQHSDFNTYHPLPVIIETLLDLLNKDTCTINTNIKPKQIHWLEYKEHLIVEYFEYLRAKAGYSFWQDLFACNVIEYFYCTKCELEWKHFSVQWMFKLPLAVNMARYWINTNGNICGKRKYLSPKTLTKQTMKELIVLLTQDITHANANQIEIVDNHFIVIDHTMHYFVYLIFLYKTDNNLGYFWKGVECHHQFNNLSIDYCQQFQYVLMFEKATMNQIQTLNLTNHYNLQFTSEIYETKNTNKKKTLLPKTITRILWPATKNNPINVHPTTIINQKTSEIQIPPYPTSDITINLTQHLSQIFKDGYLTKQSCMFCKTIETIIVKPSIYNFPTHLFLYIDQKDCTLLKIDWPYASDKLEITINDNETIKLETHIQITQTRKQEFGVQWRTSPNDWFIMQHEHLTEYKTNQQQIKHSSQSVCLLLLHNFNSPN